PIPAWKAQHVSMKISEEPILSAEDEGILNPCEYSERNPLRYLDSHYGVYSFYDPEIVRGIREVSAVNDRVVSTSEAVASALGSRIPFPDPPGFRLDDKELKTFLSLFRIDNAEVPQEITAEIPVVQSAAIHRLCRVFGYDFNQENLLRFPGITYVVLTWPFWMRDVNAWLDSAEGAGGVASAVSLIEHLYCRYPVPRFLLESFCWVFVDEIEYDNEFRQRVCPAFFLLIALGRGWSYRDFAAALGFPQWKGIERFLWQVPVTQPGEPLEISILCARLMQCGASEPVIHGILRLNENLRNPTCIDWFIRHQDDLTRDDINAVAGWANHQWYETGFVEWTRRGLRRVLREAREYEQELVRRRRVDNTPLQWESHGWDLEIESSGLSIKELLSSDALIEEGAAMLHCVGGGGYARMCATGNSAIFSVCQSERRVGTVELRLSRNRPPVIAQAQARRNSPLPHHVRGFLGRWMQEVVLRQTGKGKS
ncbi:MAG: PcfJ domain-containing protein, partial [Opitutales bacterium]|nr:PcfJ domain-containing protein [Opitutales bacterium]